MCVGGGTTDEQRGIKSVRHVRAVYPLTGAHVRSTCADRRLALGEAAFLSDGTRSSDPALPDRRRGKRRSGKAAPAVPLFPPRNEVLAGCASADVYSSWRVLDGAEPPISHIFIGSFAAAESEPGAGGPGGRGGGSHLAQNEQLTTSDLQQLRLQNFC